VGQKATAAVSGFFSWCRDSFPLDVGSSLVRACAAPKRKSYRRNQTFDPTSRTKSLPGGAHAQVQSADRAGERVTLFLVSSAGGPARVVDRAPGVVPGELRERGLTRHAGKPAASPAVRLRASPLPHPVWRKHSAIFKEDDARGVQRIAQGRAMATATTVWWRKSLKNAATLLRRWRRWAGRGPRASAAKHRRRISAAERHPESIPRPVDTAAAGRSLIAASRPGPPPGGIPPR